MKMPIDLARLLGKAGRRQIIKVSTGFFPQRLTPYPMLGTCEHPFLWPIL